MQKTIKELQKHCIRVKHGYLDGKIISVVAMGEQRFPRPKKKSLKDQVMLIMLECECIVHQEVVSGDQMVDMEVYQGFQEHLRDDMDKKRPELFEHQTSMLHHDYVLAQDLRAIKSRKDSSEGI